ncbi:DNA repair protein RAD2 [Trypanosoma theileri]|uniref:DNA repair protein RAD2 n=1 Tax=Trypanosoma theileri TaxID=67003 RepID=A0A1X0NQ29_9TRYP|nr:DNA repair protein RAD2 [Trypanosoma theileri]ORC86240.1 DNA repair protein RAD2 [Trypanosoma theileri]
MQTTSASSSISFKPVVTVGSVMHEPRKPAYRRVTPQPQDLPMHKKQPTHYSMHAAGSFMPNSTSPSILATTCDQQKAFMPTFTPLVTCVEDEADETSRELRSFEKNLRRLHRQSSRSSTARGRSSSMISDDVSESLRASRPLTPLEEAQTLVQPPLQRTVVNLLPRLFSELLLENNSIVFRLRELGRDRVLRQLGIDGKRLGMREVTSRELFFLLGCILDEKSIMRSDVEYLFRFFDWSGKGAMDFKDLLSSVSLLFVSTTMLAAVHCRRILGERVLDDSVIALADVEVMFTALNDIFAAELEEVPALCNEVRRAVEEVMPTYTVPVSTLREEVGRFPTLTQCLSAIQWDGTIDWKSVRRSAPVNDHNRTREELQRDLVRAAVAEGRETSVETVCEQENELCMDVCHPRFVADQYRVHGVHK